MNKGIIAWCLLEIFVGKTTQFGHHKNVVITRMKLPRYNVRIKLDIYVITISSAGGLLET